MAKRGKGARWVATGEPIEPLPTGDIDAAVADGLSIARFSAVLALKNRLIVAALRDDVGFDPKTAEPLAREVLDALAREQDGNMHHTDDVMERIDDEFDDQGAARHEHDYKARDTGLLEARRTVYQEVAAGIRADAADPEALATLIESARSRAWDEIGREIEARLDATRTTQIVVDAAYLRQRGERMRRLREFDLWELADSRYAPSPQPKTPEKGTSRRWFR